MARYIDADKLIEKLQVDFDKQGKKSDDMAMRGEMELCVKYNHGQYCYLNAIEQVKDAPTADVAPKSEVERWRRQLEAVLDEIPETKREVAREIFAEVEKIISRVLCLDINAYSAYEELKKKYGVTDTNVGNKYFTAEQVRAMSREEVSKNYSAIMKSMKTWG